MSVSKQAAVRPVFLIIVFFQIMPRAQNSHAVINAGFLFKINADKVIQRANIVYGGVSADFIHAKETEKYLVGKNVFKNEVFCLALQSLCDEIFPEDAPPEPHPEYRKKLAVGLFYKVNNHNNNINSYHCR